MIIDEELKFKRLKITETSGHRTSIKNKIRDKKILEIQKYFATGRLVNIFYYFIFFANLFYVLIILIQLHFNFAIFYLYKFFFH